MMTKVDAIIYELREATAHRPLAFLRALKAAFGDVNFDAFCAQMLVSYDARIDARRADLPLKSVELAEGTLDEPKEEA